MLKVHCLSSAPLRGKAAKPARGSAARALELGSREAAGRWATCAYAPCCHKWGRQPKRGTTAPGSLFAANTHHVVGRSL